MPAGEWAITPVMRAVPIWDSRALDVSVECTSLDQLPQCVDAARFELKEEVPARTLVTAGSLVFLIGFLQGQ